MDYMELAADLARNQARELIGGTDRKQERPDAHWVRGRCPECGEEVVSNCYWQGGKGCIIINQCWASLGPPEERTCTYQKVL